MLTRSSLERVSPAQHILMDNMSYSLNHVDNISPKLIPPFWENITTLCFCTTIYARRQDGTFVWNAHCNTREQLFRNIEMTYNTMCTGETLGGIGHKFVYKYARLRNHGMPCRDYNIVVTQCTGKFINQITGLDTFCESQHSRKLIKQLKFTMYWVITKPQLRSYFAYNLNIIRWLELWCHLSVV